MNRDTHVKAEQLESYVTGSASPVDEKAIEAHVAQCPMCAGALAREARLEVLFAEVGSGLPPAVQVPGRFLRWIAAGVGTAAALIAALLLAFLSPRWALDQGSRPEINRCNDAHSAAKCITQGLFNGEVSIGPDQQLIIPRYEHVETE